jgi:hypothetical protein
MLFFTQYERENRLSRGVNGGRGYFDVPRLRPRYH